METIIEDLKTQLTWANMKASDHHKDFLFYEKKAIALKEAIEKLEGI